MNDVLRSISFVRQVDAGKADWHSVPGPHVAARVLADEVERLTAELAEASEARANLARQCSHHAGLHDGAREKVAELTAEVEGLAAERDHWRAAAGAAQNADDAGSTWAHTLVDDLIAAHSIGDGESVALLRRLRRHLIEDEDGLLVSQGAFNALVAAKSRATAEVERLSSAPVIEPGGSRWLTGWLEKNPESRQRFFLVWREDRPAPRVVAVDVFLHVVGWCHPGCDGCGAATESEAKAAAERWAVETFGGSP